MKTFSKLAAAVALGAAVTSSTSAFGQAADLQLRQAKEREAQEKREQRQQNQTGQSADRQERQQLKREREQLNNMPDRVRRVLKEQTANATNIDYFKVKGEKDEGATFGATFTGADTHNYDVRIDRQGNVLSRTDLTAQQAAVQAPATPAPVPAPAPAPTPPVANAPTPPVPTPTPTPTPDSPTARGEAPKSGDPVYRRLEANEVPANIRTVLDREARGGTDVKYYRSKYGKQMSYTVRFDKGGEEQATYVADNGEVLARGGKELNDEAQTASASERANRPVDDKSANLAPGRVEIDAMPRQVQTQLRRLTEGGKDVKFYRTKYGNQQAFQANYTGKDGKEHRVFVDQDGKILSQKDPGSTK